MRQVRDFIDIPFYSGRLADLVDKLVEVQNQVPDPNPEIKMVGDDVFGRRIRIAFYRDMTDREKELDARYNHH